MTQPFLPPHVVIFSFLSVCGKLLSSLLLVIGVIAFVLLRTCPFLFEDEFNDGIFPLSATATT